MDIATDSPNGLANEHKRETTMMKRMRWEWLVYQRTPWVLQERRVIISARVIMFANWRFTTIFSLAHGKDTIPKPFITDDNFEVLALPGKLSSGTGGYHVLQQGHTLLPLQWYINL